VRLRSGDGELVVEGRLLSLEDTTVDVEARDRHRRRLTTLERADVIAARIVVDI
jgi:hypothetical protein